jgi:hypothetical protein
VNQQTIATCEGKNPVKKKALYHIIAQMCIFSVSSYSLLQVEEDIQEGDQIRTSPTGRCISNGGGFSGTTHFFLFCIFSI